MAEATHKDVALPKTKTTMSTSSFSKLKQRIETLEKEKQDLMNENEAAKIQLTHLTAEIESLRSNVSDEEETTVEVEALEEEIYDDACEEVEREIESIASRAVELEKQAFDIHKDLIAVITENEDKNVEVRSLKEEVREKEVRFERAKKQRAEAEMRVREMERKIGVLEVRESEERSKTVRLEEEVKERIDIEGRELRLWMKRIEDLEKQAEVLRGSVESAKAIMGGKVSVLQKEVKDKCLETINAITSHAAGDGKSRVSADSPWASAPVALGSTGAAVFIAVSLIYFWYAKRR